MFIRTAYNYDTMEVSNETGLACMDESLAQQHQKEESDINTIVRRFGLTGELPSNVRVPQYGDFTACTDYQTAIHAVKAAEASFMEMPAHVRARFGNDAGAFVDFCSNMDNIDEMIKLGLAIKKVEAGAGGVVINPPVDAAPAAQAAK